jgi:PAS domain S-box-containing protein
VLLWVAASGCTRFSPRAPSGPLTTVEQVRRLTREEAGAQPPVLLRGTVTFAEGGLGLLFMQDSTGGVRVEGAPLAGLPATRGRSVELTGVVASGGLSPVVSWGSVRMSSQVGPLPAPVQPAPQDLVSGVFQYRYVEIEGLVRSAVLDRSGRLVLAVRAWGRDVQIRVRDLFPSEYHSLVDSVVRAQGVLVTSFDARGVPIGVKLWVTAFNDLAVVKPAPAAADVPFRTVRSILPAGRSSPPEHRVRLRGSVSLQNGELVLRDSTGAVRLRPVRSGTIATGGPVDILGFVAHERGALVLTECTVPDWDQERRGASPLPVLTTASQVKDLPEDRARLRYPVHLRAVVTYRNPAANNTFMQDETGGIYVYLRPRAEPEPRFGDLVEVDGFARPGDFAPIVAATSLRVIGRRPLPRATQTHMEPLFTGIADSNWVEALGVVHSIRQAGELVVLGVNWGVHHFTVYVYGPTKPAGSLLDSPVRIQGVCASLFNLRRQILGIQMYVPDASFIHIEGGTRQAPPLRAIEQLLQFSSSSHFNERSRIRGVVTLVQAGSSTYVSDATGGVLVQDHAPAALKVGDSVEVIGLPVAVPGLFNPVLRDAEIRKLGEERPPEPMSVTAADILNEGYDAALVNIDAVLVDHGAGRALVLQAGNRLFEARLDQQRLPALDNGSLLRVTGIVSVQTYESQQVLLPRAFSIILRSPADIVVLEPAPWWTAARALWALGLVFAVGLLALAWIVVLRRQVRRQTADLRESRQMLQLVLDNIPQWVFWKDRESRYLGCNKACVGNLGVLTPEAIVGKTDYDLEWRTNADAYVAVDRQVMESGQAKIGYEEPLIAADGTQRWVRTSKAPLYGPRGEVIGVLGVDEDITDRKRAEEQLQRYSAQLAESNAELKRFTHIVSHDLRAPLINLHGFAAELRSSLEVLRKPVERLLPNLPEPERAAVAQALEEGMPEALGFIESSVTRMDHLNSALLQLARVGHQDFHMQELDTGELLRETLRTLAHQIESHKVELKIGPLPRITSDRTAIEQIFGNLLDNALKYLDPRRAGQIEVSAEETAEAVVFQVRDNGRGIAEQDMDKVFAPFRRAGAQDVPGEGMGLAYVRALLQRLDGRIECHSKLGAGSTFIFTIPRAK